TTLSREESWWKEKSLEDVYAGILGGITAADGRMREAERLFRKSADIALRTGHSDFTTRFVTATATLYALYGNHRRAIDIAKEAMKGEHQRNVLVDSGFAFAAAGDEAG